MAEEYGVEGLTSSLQGSVLRAAADPHLVTAVSIEVRSPGAASSPVPGPMGPFLAGPCCRLPCLGRAGAQAGPQLSGERGPQIGDTGE